MAQKIVAINMWSFFCVNKGDDDDDSDNDDDDDSALIRLPKLWIS